MDDDEATHIVHHDGRRYAYDRDRHQLYDVDNPDKRTAIADLEDAIAKRIQQFEDNGGLRANRDACSPIANLSIQLDAALGREPSELTRKLATAWQLPTVQLAEGKFFIDERLGEMRNVDDPHHVITHVEFLADLVQMAAHLGRKGGTERMGALVDALIQRSNAFHTATGNDPTDYEKFLRDMVDTHTPDPLPERKRNRALN